MSKSYWRWHHRYALLPTKVQGKWVWLKHYWWRVPFEMDYPIRTIYRTLNQPEYDYTDEIAVDETVDKMLAKVGLRRKVK